MSSTQLPQTDPNSQMNPANGVVNTAAPNTAPPTPAPINPNGVQSLPPTGLQQQLNSLNQFYDRARAVQFANLNKPGEMMTVGVDTNQFQFENAGNPELMGQMGSNSLDSIARNLAERYGLPIGRGRIVDEQGNFLYTPEQLADASGGTVTMGEAAAQMNYISQALANYRNEQQQKKGIAALQTGMGQVQSRGRGSMASMMSGYYQGIADLYANQEYEAADFSYYIQKEQLEVQQELQSRYEKMLKNQARGMFWGGIAITIIGLAAGNGAMAAQGSASVANSAGQTGYF